MVEKIETLLLLLGLVGLLAVAAERLKFPFPILLVIAGLLIAMVPRLPSIHLDSDLVLVVFLPPLLFSAAWNFPWEEFRANLMPIFGLAVVLVFATMTAVAFTAVWLVPGMTMATAFVLGAIVSPPDAVAATSIFHKLRVPRRLVTVLEGESLVNDSSGLVAYQFAVAAVVTGSFSFAQASGEFVWMSVGGILFGWLIGIIAARLHRRIGEPAVEITLTILTPYAAYLGAEQFGFSGVLACVAAGLHVGHRAWEALSPESRLQRDAIWKFIDYLLNGIVFILIGLQFPTIIEQLEYFTLWQAVAIGAIISCVVILVRFALVGPTIWLERLVFRHSRRQEAPLKPAAIVVASWAGMRGVVSLAAALALPTLTHSGAAFPHRHLIIFITFSVIFTTLVLQGLTLPFLVRILKVEESSSDYQSEADTRVAVFEELICEIDRQIAQKTDTRAVQALEFWRGNYAERISHLKDRLGWIEDNNSEELQEQKYFPILMNHARRYIAQMRARGEISEQMRRRIEYDFDLEEQRIARIIQHHPKS